MATSQRSQMNLGAGKRLLERATSPSPVDAALAESSASSAPPDVSAPSSGLQLPQLNLQNLLSQLGSSAAARGSGGAGNGSWSGPLGTAPQHHGWDGLQDGAKQWTLRLLGAFPDLRFTSGYRTPEHNARVGGVANSGHTRGWKVDLVGSSKLMHEAASWAQRYGAKTLLHDAGSGFHLDISWEGVPF